MNYADRRERALIIFEEQIGLIPTEIQVQSAIWGCQREMREVAEEVCEYLRAARNFPVKPKQDVFFPED